MMKKSLLISFALAFVSFVSFAQTTNNKYGLANSEWNKASEKTKALLKKADLSSFVNYVILAGKGGSDDYRYFMDYAHSSLQKDKNELIYKISKGEITSDVQVKKYLSSLQPAYIELFKKYKTHKESMVSERKDAVARSFSNPPKPFACGSACTNPSFESGTGFWDYWSATACASSTGDPCSLVPGFDASQMSLQTAGGYDPAVGGTILPVVAPGSGSSSLMLCDGPVTGGYAARASISFTVDSNSTNFTYRYAVVLQDPVSGHTDEERPYFKVKLRDQLGNILPCGDYEVMAKPPITGFFLVSGTTDIYYRPWTSVFVPLTAYIGQCVTLEFTASDCALGGHYGYAYIDADCAPSGLISSSPAVCGGNSVTLSAPSGAASYDWVNNATGDSTGVVGSDTSQTAVINQGGTYNVTMTSVMGSACTLTMTITVPSNPSNPVPAFASDTVCAGTPTTFTDFSTPADSISLWEWDFDGDGVVDDTAQNPTHIFPTGGTYPVSLDITWGPCVVNITQNVYVYPTGSATINPVTTQCTTNPAFNLSATPTGGTWSGTGITNASSGTFDPATAGVGTHVITYTVGGSLCPNVDTVQITVLQGGNAGFSLPANLCVGSTTIIDLNTTFTTGTPGGTWSGTGVTGNIFDPTGLTGSVTITYTVGTGICQQTSSQTVTINAVTAAFTATPTSGDAPLVVDVLNGSTNANAYQWSFGNGATSTNVNDSTVYMNQGTYTITLIATNTTTGCSDTVSVLVEVFEHSILVVPNVFTPNGDGNNDYFNPVLAEGLTSYKIQIYDRWGLKMYEGTNSSTGWEGKAKNGSPAPDGTYYYILSANGIDSKEYEFTGYVQLIRK